MPILGTIASSITRSKLSTTSFESISTTTVGSGGSSTITFSSIPATFTHLQLRIITLTANPLQSAVVTFNGTNGGIHWLTGNGSTASGANDTAKTYFPLTQGSSTAPSAGIMDILDYANTNKFKTTRMLDGSDLAGSGNVSITSGLYQSTSAVSSITITAAASGSFNQYSSFALYGIKGA